jgi:hypothetical protein
MSGMKKRPVRGNEYGAVNGLLLPLLVAVLLLIGAVVFGFWAYGSRQDYKDNVDAKITTAVAAAKQAESTSKEKEFAERDKNPLRTYTGPSEFGSIGIQYPKTWSAYVADDAEGSPFVDGYFQPSVVPDIQSENSIFALRVQVVDSSYSEELQNFSDDVTSGKLSVQPYAAPKVPKIVGSKISGQLTDKISGEKVLLPLRDKTLEIWTESNQYIPDFENIILANLTFQP